MLAPEVARDDRGAEALRDEPGPARRGPAAADRARPEGPGLPAARDEGVRGQGRRRHRALLGQRRVAGLRALDEPADRDGPRPDRGRRAPPLDGRRRRRDARLQALRRRRPRRAATSRSRASGSASSASRRRARSSPKSSGTTPTASRSRSRPTWTGSTPDHKLSHLAVKLATKRDMAEVSAMMIGRAKQAHHGIEDVEITDLEAESARAWAHFLDQMRGWRVVLDEPRGDGAPRRRRRRALGDAHLVLRPPLRDRPAQGDGRLRRRDPRPVPPRGVRARGRRRVVRHVPRHRRLQGAVGELPLRPRRQPDGPRSSPGSPRSSSRSPSASIPPSAPRASRRWRRCGRLRAARSLSVPRPRREAGESSVRPRRTRGPADDRGLSRSVRGQLDRSPNAGLPPSEERQAYDGERATTPPGRGPAPRTSARSRASAAPGRGRGSRGTRSTARGCRTARRRRSSGGHRRSRDGSSTA